MPRTKKPTLTDVARRAGVSVTTASYILNGRTTQMRIAEATEQRVRQAMLELEYRPNWSARSLRGSSTRTIGFVSDFVASGGFSSRLIAGANAAARSCDHVVIIGETMGNAEVELLVVEEMIDRQVDGILYATRSASRVRLPEALRGVRTVLLNCVDERLDLPAVVADDVAGGVMATEVLVARGSVREVYVVGEDPTPEASAGEHRMEGILSCLAAAGHRLTGVVACEWDVPPAFEAVSAWLATGVRPSALICLNDRIAMGAYQALERHGLRVPQDVAVISFDGSDLASWLRPRLTSLALPFTEMGTRAVEILMDPDGVVGGRTLMRPVLLAGDSA